MSVADIVEASPANVLNAHKRNAIDALVVALEGKLATIATGKQ